MAFPAHAVLPCSRPWWRGVAMLAAALIVFLLVASASPAVHDWCCDHAHATASSDGGCAVFCFAGGVVSTTGAVTAPAPMFSALDTVGVGSAELALPSTVWRTPPACGPPAAV